jgi:hypothetical protein
MTRAEREALVRECRASGQSARAWCQGRGISYRSYMNWVKLIPKETAAREGAPSEARQEWVAVSAAIGSSGKTGSRPIRLECGAWAVIVEGGFEPEALRAVLRAVTSCC